MLHSLASLINPITLIKTAGIVGVFLIVFAESGLFFGFFFPGDSLLFTAGIFAGQHLISIWYLIIGSIIAAILGDTIGYWFGRRLGPRIFSRDDSLFFKKKHAERTRQFYAEYGSKTIVLARFVPVVRTFAPILAGVADMPYRIFAVFNIAGGIGWVALVTGAGFFLGNSISNIDHYILPIVAIIITISILPILFEYVKNRRSTK